MRVKARAKLNWTLDITGRRADGYHLLDMLVQSLELSDEIELTEADELALTIENDETLSADNNLILKAARALQSAANTKKGAAIHLQKNIPTQAGLGGGSADAAAALKALNALWQTGLSDKMLEEIGLSLGADVPYCLRGGAMRVRGIGERLSPIAVSFSYPVVLIKPCEGLSTKEVYARADTLAPLHPMTSGAMDALALGDLALLNRCAANALFPAARQMRPELEAALDALIASGASFSAMTGSGCVVYGVYKTALSAQAAYQMIQKDYPDAILTRTLSNEEQEKDSRGLTV